MTSSRAPPTTGATPRTRYRGGAAIDLEGCVEFLQRLIRTPSLPGEEGEIARLVAARMEALGYDVVEIDAVGNVLGWIRGRGDAPALLFNTHLDHVDVGDPGRWPHPPFGGEIRDDRVWGRGAVDIKGPLAAQVYGVAQLMGTEPPPGDVWVTAVVQEEVGGVGARHLAAAHASGARPTPIAVVGEPSRNTLRRGHRGRTELVVHVEGRSVHASVPERGLNPLYVLARFLDGIGSLDMPTDPDLGASSVAPTLLRTDQTSANVVPGEVWQTCDWRNIPGQSADAAQRMLEALVERVLASDPSLAEARVEVVIPQFDLVTHTGIESTIPAANPAYILAAEHPAIEAAAAICREVQGEAGPVGVWHFATDGGHFAEVGIAPIGFGPGDELLAHTVHEHIEIAALEEAMRVNAALARRLALAAS